MNIKKLYIKNFGKLKDFSFDFDEGLNVIYGENEAGKSTITSFINAVFYKPVTSRTKPISENPRVKYMPWSGEIIEGYLIFSHNDNIYRAAIKYGKAGRNDVAILTDEITGKKIDYELNSFNNIGEFIFGLSEQSFSKTAFISQLSTIIDKNGNDEIITKLSNLRQTGDEDISFKNAFEKLEAWQKLIRNPQGRVNVGEITALENENTKLRDNIWKSKNQQIEIETQKSNLAQIKKNIDNIANEIATVQTTISAFQQTNAIKRYWELKNNITRLNTSLTQKKKELTTTQIELDNKKCVENLPQNPQNIIMNLNVKIQNSTAEKTHPSIIERYKMDRELNFLWHKRSKILMVLSIMAAIVGITLSALLPVQMLYLGSTIGVLGVIGSIFFIFKGKKHMHICNQIEITLKNVLNYESEIDTDIEKATREIQQLYTSVSAKDHDDFISIIEEYALVKNEKKILLMNIDSLNAQINQTKEELDILKPQITKSEVIADNNVNLKVTPNIAHSDIDALKAKIPVLIQKNTELITMREKLIIEITQQDKFASAVDLESQIIANDDKIRILSIREKALSIAGNALNESFNTLQKDFTPIINQRLEEIICNITQNKYNKASVSENFQVLVGDESAVHNGEYLSFGTIQMLYLSLRLSLWESIMGQNNQGIFAILDDTLIAFDDNRAKKTLQFISKLTENNGQILYFTCQKRDTNEFNEKIINI